MNPEYLWLTGAMELLTFFVVELALAIAMRMRQGGENPRTASLSGTDDMRRHAGRKPTLSWNHYQGPPDLLARSIRLLPLSKTISARTR